MHTPIVFGLFSLILACAGGVSALQVSVSPAQVLSGAVSRGVFGANCQTASADGRVALPRAFAAYPVCRWGGNAATRYNFVADCTNHASDWFFLNEPATLPDGSNSADAFVESVGAAGARALVTIPTLGWVCCSGGAWGPGCAAKAAGFDTAKYAYVAAATECTASGDAGWCSPTAGNGVVNGTNKDVVGNDPRDTSVPSNASFGVAMAEHLVGLRAAPPPAAFEFALDNEPQLWHSTHRDAHPLPTTYDELWEMTLAYGGALKAALPASLVHGPIPWGWCAYWSSAADDCVSGPDREAHNNTPIIQWLFEQVAQHKAATGVQVLDVLDVHFYPQATGVDSGSEDPATAALRFRSLQGLYNASYVDESWIGEPVMLLPRLRGWLAAAEAATGVELDVAIAVSEYSFGNDGLITTSLAHAEAMAIMAREGVYQATVWVQPAVGGVGEAAYALMLNYDGKNATIAGSAAVAATSEDVGAVGAYAFLAPAREAPGSSPTLQMVLIAKQAAGIVNVSISVAWDSATIGGGANWVRANVYQYGKGGASAPALVGVLDFQCGAGAAPTTVSLPPWSGTVIEMPFAC